ncbi:MAG TPA: N-acetylmuramoyl-L-alanine amidase [Chloroflexia bacterium]|nr:N-acetylmuramoyl-L-alanine amidase [Chloroflexia bacterium]
MNIYADYSNRLDPNCYTQGRQGSSVLVLVCHSTCGPDDRNFPGQDPAVAQRLSDQAAAYLTSNDRQVSIHWLVGAEACGAPIYRVVPEEHTAYHCGGTPPQFPSRWVNPTDGKEYGRFGLNLVSLGIELFGQANDTVGPKQLSALQTLVQNIAGRYPVLGNNGHIVDHASLEGDRTDGKNWVTQARGFVGSAGAASSSAAGFSVVPIQYMITIPAGSATVRSGPGRSYSIITSLSADPQKIYHVDGEAHGEQIGNDDVWSHVAEAGGFVTRTAVKIMTPA